MGVRGASFFLAFVATLLVARLLGIHEFGIYSEALAWGSVAAIVGTLGVDRFAVREVAAYKATNSWEELRGLLDKLPRLTFALSGSISLAAVAVVWFAEPFGSERSGALYIALLGAPLMSVSILRQGILQGLGKVVASCLPEDVARPLIFMAAVTVGITIIGLPQKATTAMAFQLVGIAMSFGLGLLLLRRYLPEKVKLSRREPLTNKKLQAAMPIAVFVTVNILLTQTGILSLGLLSTPDQVAIYSVAFKIAIGVGLAEYAVSIAYQPIVSTLLIEGRLDQTKSIAPKVALFASVLTLPIALLVLLLHGEILDLFGTGFQEGKVPLFILVASYVVNPIFGQNGALLTMSKHVDPLVKSTIVALLINVGANIMLNPTYGATGAALAWLFTLMSWNLMLTLQVKRHLGFWPTIFSVRRQPSSIDPL